MDESLKARFKWKFYRLTVELNIIVLLVAMSVPVFLIIQSPLTVPVVVVMLGFALVLSIDFVKKYRETKAWLDDNTEKEKEPKDDNKSSSG
jgi:Ca2+/Na+ antiporter